MDKIVSTESQGVTMEPWQECHGDEDFIAEEARRCAEEYEAEHADDYKCTDLESYEHE